MCGHMQVSLTYHLKVMSFTRESSTTRLVRLQRSEYTLRPPATLTCMHLVGPAARIHNTRYYGSWHVSWVDHVHTCAKVAAGRSVWISHYATATDIMQQQPGCCCCKAASAVYDPVALGKCIQGHCPHVICAASWLYTAAKDHPPFSC